MRRKILSIMLVMTLLIGTCGVAVAADSKGGATRAYLKSYGSIEYHKGDDKVVINADDLYMLADQIDQVKLDVADQLEAMNTYFTAGDGISLSTDDDINIAHSKPSGSDTVDPLSVNFDTMLEGIAASQSVPTDVTDYGYSPGTKLYKNGDGSLTTNGSENGATQITVTEAKAENLSAGTVAWVNGELILGTGGDNKSYLDKGKQNTTMIKKLLSLFYTHSETEESFALNDTTGKGYSTGASCSNNNSKYGTQLTLRSEKIPLYDLSDEDHPKLLYKIQYNFTGDLKVPTNCHSEVIGSINLCDENGVVISTNKTAGNPKEFVLTNYNTDTDYIYIDITAQAYVHGYGSGGTISITYEPTITGIYYSDPE